jgi:hypothetical protein
MTGDSSFADLARRLRVLLVRLASIANLDGMVDDHAERAGGSGKVVAAHGFNGET